jgi:hypothetical protein
MLAWDDIASDKRLVLVEGQREDARSRASDARKGAQQAIRKAWSHLLSPSPSAADPAVVELERLAIKTSGQTSICEAAWQKAAEGHAVLELLGRTTLLERLEQIWPSPRDDLEIDVLRDWFCEFPYMERLRDEQVLADAISAAVADISDDGLGLASGKDDNGRYQDLHVHKRIEPRFNMGMLVVRNAVARAQVAAGVASVPVQPGAASSGKATPASGRASPQSARRPTRFVGVVELDALRGLARAGQVFESVINELDRVPGTKFRITLEVSAIAEVGFPEDVENVVKDNTGTLGFIDKRFD